VQECNGVLLFVVTTDLDISSGKRYKREAVILEFVLDPPDKPLPTKPFDSSLRVDAADTISQ
jgi:hypothetical protein